MNFLLTALFVWLLCNLLVFTVLYTRRPTRRIELPAYLRRPL